jgi:hypothetical protein
MDDILFAKVNIAILNKELAVQELIKIDEKFWFWDPYRATNMLPLMTKESVPGKDGSSNDRLGNFHWLPYTPDIIKDWFENHVFPWMTMKTRIMLLKTESNFSNNEHIDCALNEVGTRQHKFRVVLKGTTDTLYFKTLNGNVSVPNIQEPFIMDGGWVHGMSNFTNEVKFTIAAGAPWSGKHDYNNIEVLMKKSNFRMPADLSQYLK